jgi:murein DD-endopeptidase MepM/ murein hydrolase activator NlpD
MSSLNKFLLPALLCTPFILAAQSYPLIPELQSQDPVFSQYQDEVCDANKAISLQLPAPLNLYAYKAKKNDTVLSVAARCAITYDTFVTANAIGGVKDEIAGRPLVLPTVNGLFIPLKPENSIEILLAKEYSTQLLNAPAGTYTVYTIKNRKYYFMPSERFSPADRAFFLDASLRLPLDHSVLTSSFGMRISPISGTWKMHKGIDMAAAVGTKVYACKAGTVTFTGYDATYGNYIIIKHDGGLTSLYAHLSQIFVKKDQLVSTGYNIGKVGVTGATTGPHLHFELRVNGSAQDPQKYIDY